MGDKKRDTLFSSTTSGELFAFDKNVAEVFDDMATRSIPGYEIQQYFISEYVCHFLNVHEEVSIIDVGCSTGETILAIYKRAMALGLDVSKHNILASDYSSDMIVECEKKLSSLKKKWKRYNLVHARAQDIASLFEQAGDDIVRHSYAIILHFVLQFVPQKDRGVVLKSCWETLAIGGMMFVGEKIKSSNEMTQVIWEHLQYKYKKEQGYSDIQIQAKKQALEGVLIPDYGDDLYARLHNLPNAKVEIYYAHGEFRCMTVEKLPARIRDVNLSVNNNE